MNQKLHRHKIVRRSDGKNSRCPIYTRLAMKGILVEKSNSKKNLHDTKIFKKIIRVLCRLLV